MKVHVFFFYENLEYILFKKGKVRAVVYLIYSDTDFLISSSL